MILAGGEGKGLLCLAGGGGRLFEMRVGRKEGTRVRGVSIELVRDVSA